MKFIQGHNRNQITLFPVSLDQSIDPDNEVRLIDLFVDSLSLKDYGFRTDFPENGPPAYHPSDLLKLFIYGYLNKVRSSRDLEKECKRNIEVMWLMKGLRPDHNTIANFRRDNSKAIKKVFRATVEIARHFDLIGGKLIAGDSTKLRARNSKKNNFNQTKIDRHIAYIDNKLDEYTRALAENDRDNKDLIRDEIKKLQERKENYREIEKQIKESGEKQVSTSDPESRQIMLRNNITEVAYNVQTTVDAKHNIPIDYKVTNENDSKAMGNMVQRAKSILRTNEFTVLYDNGFHTGTELKTAQELGVETIVAIPGVTSTSQAPKPDVQLRVFHLQPRRRHIHLSCRKGSAHQWIVVQSAQKRRIANILTPEVMKEYLRILIASFSSIFDLIKGILMTFKQRLFHLINLPLSNCIDLITAKTLLFPVKSERLLDRLLTTYLDMNQSNYYEINLFCRYLYPTYLML